VADVFNELKSFSLNVEIVDPHADSDELQHEYGFSLTKQISNVYDAIIVAVPHNDYKALDDAYFAGITKPGAIVADLKGIFRGKITSRKYWSL
jgi:UDP-N-acetyl-D-galactosamine dehydrogenase